jgi:colicin import membrane protein
MIAEQNQLTQCIEQNGLSVDKSTQLVEAFMPLFLETDNLIAAADSIVVTDAAQLTEMKQARETRLKLKDIRVAAEKNRKQFKEEYLKAGRAIDSIAGIIKGKIEPVEARLQEQEEFAKRIEQTRKAELRIARHQLLSPFGVDTSFYNLEEMPEATFAQLLESTRTAHGARLEATRKAEAERIAAEKARRDEQERIRKENEQLRIEREAAEKVAREERAKVERERLAAEAKAKAERDAIEAKARKEREAAEAELAKERKAREALEAKARAEKEAAAKKAAAEQKARLKAERAPDRDKVIQFADSLRVVTIPTMTTPIGQQAAEKMSRILQAAAEEIERLVVMFD